MPIRVVRLGAPRLADEGPRLGTVRRPPRGVRKEDYARQDWFDHWLPELAPSAELVTWAMSEPLTEQRWQRFGRSYRREMGEPDRQRLLGLLALLSRQASFSVGCYCEDDSRCHRTVLRELLLEHGAELA